MMTKRAEFFKKMIKKSIKVGNCENCGDRLQNTHFEIAHIIAKGDKQNPEVGEEENNIVFLCQTCHQEFDRSLTRRQQMKVFDLSVARYQLFKDKIIKITKEVLLYERNEC